jgi:hypothetical protein
MSDEEGEREEPTTPLDADDEDPAREPRSRGEAAIRRPGGPTPEERDVGEEHPEHEEREELTTPLDDDDRDPPREPPRSRGEAAVLAPGVPPREEEDPLLQERLSGLVREVRPLR